MRKFQRVLAIGAAIALAAGQPLGARALSPSTRASGRSFSGASVKPAAWGVVNFKRLARREAARRASQKPPYRNAPNPEIPEPAVPPGHRGGTPTVTSTTLSQTSPAPVRSFGALGDIPVVGTNFRSIPPDTQGTVGPDHVFVTLNSNYRIQRKSDGSVISTVSMQTFWATTGATDAFDPRTLYDPYHHRWLVAATSNRRAASSSLLVGVSRTSDPTGLWYLSRFDADSANTMWADYPTLGFNKNWVAVAVNMFTSSAPTTFKEGRLLVLDFASMRDGPPTTQKYFTGQPFFTLQPAATYSATEPTLFGVSASSDVAGTYRFWTITGTPGSPILTFVGIKTNPLGGWTDPSRDSHGIILPQLCSANCPGALRKIDAGDQRVLKAVFRNDHVWYSQTVGIPADGVPGHTPVKHTAAQWVEVDTGGNFVQGGRIEDATATPSNGGAWYGYPSIAVNARDDVLIGYSQAESDDFVDSGYSLHLGTDPAGAMRSPRVFKGGEDYYEQCFGTQANRWGDYSATTVDPDNDLDLWTLQEYAETRVDFKTCASTAGDTGSRWGTWWADVSPGTEWATGDLFLGVGGGVANARYQVRSPGGNLLETLDQGTTSYAAGCTLAHRTLWTTNWGAGGVVGFDEAPPHGIVGRIDTSPYLTESVVTDPAGNLLVGTEQSAPNPVLKYRPDGTLLDTYPVQTEDQGSDWIELASDGRTLYYTSEGVRILRYDLATKTQLSDFTPSPSSLSAPAYAFRLLPPGDGSGGLIVADRDDIKRLDGQGKVLKSYDAPGEDFWFSINIDPDRSSFWAGDLVSGHVYRFDIGTGGVLTGPVDSGVGSYSLLGICLKGEPTAGRADLSVGKTDTPDPVKVGGTLKYTIPVKNLGPSMATGVRLADALPSSVLLVAAKPSRPSDRCSRSGPRVNCTLNTLAPGVVATVVLTVIPTKTGSITNRASASSDVTDPVATNNSHAASTTVQLPSCTKRASAPGAVVVGTNHHDVLCGLAGNETLKGLGGNDVLIGRSGGDLVIGGSGYDILFGNGGADTLRAADGTRGNDAADGGLGVDACVLDSGDIKRGCP
jgi:uncharacterized repeat protein (TIGR01451 family)